MSHLRATLHRYLLGAVLLGNAIAFAGLDASAQLATAVVALVLAADLSWHPPTPKPLRLTLLLSGSLAALYLIPLPLSLRALVQPGLEDVMHAGWAPLSLAPWGTIRVIAGAAVVAALAFTAARMAATRTGLPALLWLIAGTAGLLAMLGLLTETGLPDRVLMLRSNTGQGMPYGPYVNRNHFALGLELSLPAAGALLAVWLRHLRKRAARSQALVRALATATIVVIGTAALVRCGSRGGLLMALAGGGAGLLIGGRGSSGRTWWRAAAASLIILALAAGLAANRLPDLQDSLKRLMIVDNQSGSTRLGIWSSSLRLWQRSPVLGSGPGSYDAVIGLDRPASGALTLEHGHGSWLEWLATSGLVGAVLLMAIVTMLISSLRPGRLRQLRFELRYPAAASAAALIAVALHEVIGSALHTPLNRYLLAAWLGLVWGLASRAARQRRQRGGEKHFSRADQGQPTSASMTRNAEL